MWHLIAHFDGKIYDLGACFNQQHLYSMQRVYNEYCKGEKNIACEMKRNPPKYLSQLDFIKDYKTKNFMNAQLETPDVAAKFDDEG